MVGEEVGCRFDEEDTKKRLATHEIQTQQNITVKKQKLFTDEE